MLLLTFACATPTMTADSGDATCSADLPRYDWDGGACVGPLDCGRRGCPTFEGFVAGLPYWPDRVIQCEDGGHEVWPHEIESSSRVSFDPDGLYVGRVSTCGGALCIPACCDGHPGNTTISGEIRPCVPVDTGQTGSP